MAAVGGDRRCMGAERLLDVLVHRERQRALDRRGGPWKPDGWPGTEVGWGIARWAQRRGYANEAATAAIDWAFDALGWSEVIHCIDPLNAASVATAKRLGSDVLRRGVVAPAPLLATWDVYGQTREQWRARKSR
jgi:RimJ/RimL family protein N-acetyltransferase